MKSKSRPMILGIFASSHCCRMKVFANIDVLKDTLDQSLKDYDYFMCGPKPMIDGLMKDLKASGVQRRRIHTEEFEFR